MSGEGAIGAGLGKAKNLLLDWGVPVVSLVVGAMLGDAIKVAGFLADLIPVKIGAKGMGVLVAALYAVIGSVIWYKFDGIIGHAIGAFLFGMALGTAYQAFTGKTFNIPGFGEG